MAIAKLMMILLLILIIVLIIVVLVMVYINKKEDDGKNNPGGVSINELYNASDPGILLSMLTINKLSSGDLDLESINVNKCIKLGSISKPVTNIMDLTLLNNKLPLNIYNANSSVTNIGIILDPSKIIPKDNPSKFVQCCGVRDRGSDLRRCDTDFDHKLGKPNHKQHTIGKYGGQPLRKITQDCTCTYNSNDSNTCNTKAELVGCGAKCSDKGQECGKVTWCVDQEPASKLGPSCAWNPRDMDKFVTATVNWNKACVKNKWDVSHKENELDAYIENTSENQQTIIDSILGFVYTDYCGTIKCSSDVSSQIQSKMKRVVADFNKFYVKNVGLYHLIIDPQINTGKFDGGKIVAWEDNNFTSDWATLAIPIKVDALNVTQPKQMYTYRVAQTVDGISGKNTGDIRGDNSYISGEFCKRHGDDVCQSAKMSQYNISYLPINPLNPSMEKDGITCTSQDNNMDDCKVTLDGFGNYALCNPGGKVGGDESVPYECTSCNDKNIVNYKTACTHYPGVGLDRFSGGKWFSWPQETKCGPDQAVGQGGCNWKLVGDEPKSTTVKNLVDNGYKLLLTDTYNSYQTDCRNNNNCLSNRINKEIQDNEEQNINVINKIFNVVV